MNKLIHKFTGRDKDKVTEIDDPRPTLQPEHDGISLQERWEQHMGEVVDRRRNDVGNPHSFKIRIPLSFTFGKKTKAFLVTCLIPLGIILLPYLLGLGLFSIYEDGITLGWFLKGPMGTPKGFIQLWVNGVAQLLVGGGLLIAVGALFSIFVVMLRGVYNDLTDKFE
jgi:hypothetical protein